MREPQTAQTPRHDSTPWLWVVLTLVGATGLSLRNAAQKGLTGRLGTVGATHVRFLYGLPFGLLALGAVYAIWGELPTPTPLFLAWTAAGAVSQIAATALMLAAMRERSFVVATAYTKTEPVQIAIFVVVFLGEEVTLMLATAVTIATAGVLVMSWPSRRGGEAFSWQPALLGMASGALFAMAAVGFRGGITALSASFIPAATLTLATALALQTVVLSIWLLMRRPQVMRDVRWRGALPSPRDSSARSPPRCGSSLSPCSRRRGCARWAWWRFSLPE